MLHWVCLVQCVPKKGWMIVVPNEMNELIMMDYKKFNACAQKDHFSHVLHGPNDRQAWRQGFYCFLDKYSISNNIYITLEDQENISFIWPYKTFAFKGMLFVLFNASVTFLHCMMLIFTKMVEDTIDVLMDDFLSSVTPLLGVWIILTRYSRDVNIAT